MDFLRVQLYGIITSIFTKEKKYWIMGLKNKSDSTLGTFIELNNGSPGAAPFPEMT